MTMSAHEFSDTYLLIIPNYIVTTSTINSSALLDARKRRCLGVSQRKDLTALTEKWSITHSHELFMGMLEGWRSMMELIVILVLDLLRNSSQRLRSFLTSVFRSIILLLLWRPWRFLIRLRKRLGIGMMKEVRLQRSIGDSSEEVSVLLVLSIITVWSFQYLCSEYGRQHVKYLVLMT